MEQSSLPDIFALTIFIVCFQPLVRRVGPHVNLWFLGWTCLLFKQILGLLPFHSASAASLLFAGGNLCSDVCVLCFILVSANVPRRQIGRALAACLAVPKLFASALLAFPHHPALLDDVACVLFLAPVVLFAVRPRKRDGAILLMCVAFALFGCAALFHAPQHPEFTARGARAVLFLAAGYLYMLFAERATRGVVIAVVGLFTWGFTYPLQLFIAQVAPGTHLAPGLFDLPGYLVVAGTVLSMLQEHVQRTERMALHDPLTDLPNRRLFEERLIAAMEEARQNRTTIACLVIDVDNFKTINDTLGHSAGDQLLRALAVRLQWHMSPRDILARTGGDEFTALLAGVNDEHHLRFIASAMMSAGSVPIAIDGQSVDLRISVGIALSPDDADDIDSLRRAADEAMYSAKRRGGSMLAFAGEL